MVGRKELSEDLRKSIVDSHNNGNGYKKISKLFHIPVATVQSIIKKHKRFGTVHNIGKRGRHRKIEPQLERRLIRDINIEPFTTVKDLKKNVLELGVEVCNQTIRNTSQEWF